MARVLSFLIRYFSYYYTLHRSDLAARAAPLDPRLLNSKEFCTNEVIRNVVTVMYDTDRIKNRVYFLNDIKRSDKQG